MQKKCLEVSNEAAMPNSNDADKTSMPHTTPPRGSSQPKKNHPNDDDTTHTFMGRLLYTLPQHDPINVSCPVISYIYEVEGYGKKKGGGVVHVKPKRHKY